MTIHRDKESPIERFTNSTTVDYIFMANTIPFVGDGTF